MKKLSLSIFALLFAASFVMADVKAPVKTTKPAAHKSLKKATCAKGCKKKGC